MAEDLYPYQGKIREQEQCQVQTMLIDKKIKDDLSMLVSRKIFN